MRALVFLAAFCQLFLLSAAAWGAEDEAGPGRGWRSACAESYARFAGSLRSFREKLQGYSPEDKKLVAVQYLRHLLGQEAPRFFPPVQGGRAKRFLVGGGRAVASGIEDILRLLVPVQLPAHLRSPVQRIFFEQWRNPAFAPSTEEISLLRKAGAYALFQGRQKFYAAHPYVLPLREGLDFTASVLLLLNASMALQQAGEMHGHTTTIDDLVNASAEDEQGNPKVQLFVETTPFPHTALRIGHKVYSYGVDYMTSKGVDEYLAVPLELTREEILEQRRKRDQKKKETDPAALARKREDEAGSSERSLGNEGSSASLAPARIAEALGLDDAFWDKVSDSTPEPVKKNWAAFMKRSLRVTDLRLDPEKVRRLQRELELNTGKKYLNETMVHDCSTMIKRALGENRALEIPEAIDALPSVTSTYLSLLRVLGDKRIGPTQLVLSEKGDSQPFHLARDAYIAMLEGKLALGLLPFNGPARARIDLTKSPEELQHHEPAFLGDINTWRADTRKEMEEYLRGYLERVPGTWSPEAMRSLSAAARQRKLREARELLEDLVPRQEAKARKILDFSGSEFKDVVKAAEEVEALEALRAQWLARIRAFEELQGP